MRVAIVGGGAGGLLAARLLARQHPAWTIQVYERLLPARTFGFGVGLTGALLAGLRSADLVVHDALIEAGHRSSMVRFRMPAGSLDLGRFSSGVSIGRTVLLRVLLELAQQAGVEVQVGQTASASELAQRADLVVGADGGSSSTREGLAERLTPTITYGRGLMIWCGSTVPLPGTTFMPVTTEHGLFVAHAYPYSPRRSTVVIETDKAAWTAAGMASTGVLDPLSGESDAATLDYLATAFEELLEGHPLLGNKSRWGHFRTVRCARWSAGNVVILGDAAATAHPTLGSGTKLAMESAISFAAALEPGWTCLRDLRIRLAEFEASRREPVERLQGRAHRSQLWWESVSTRLHLSPARFAAAFMSRAGAVSLADLARDEPDVLARAAADFADTALSAVPTAGLLDWVLHRPLATPHGTLPARLFDRRDGACPRIGVEVPVGRDEDPWGPSGDLAVARAHGARSADAGVVLLTGAGDRAAVLDRLALGDRLRSETRALVMADLGPDGLDDAAMGLISGRIDLALTGVRT